MKSVKRLFADSNAEGKLTSNKGVIGHCMGAAGALELFISAKSLEDHLIPPTHHGQKQNDLTGIHIVKEAEADPCTFVISNSFAFGGNNVSVGISTPGHFSDAQLDRKLIDDEVVVTGIGCVGNKHSSFEEYVALLENDDTRFARNDSYVGKYHSVYHGVIPEYDYRRYLSPDFFRKTDFISKLSMISSASAIKDAGIKITRANAERIGLVYGTGTGPISTIEQLNLDIIQKGLAGMNAFFFPNSVNNAAPGYITMNSRMKGTTITINSGGATFAVNLLYAKLVLLQNKADQVIVTVSDDYNEIYHAAYDRLGLLSKEDRVTDFFGTANTLILSPGSVSVVLERKRTAAERGARTYARVVGGVLSGDCNTINGLNFQSDAMSHAFEAALEASGMAKDELDLYFAASTGISVLDYLEKCKVVAGCGETIISSARQFCGYNVALIPAYSALSAIAAFEGHPVSDIIRGQSLTRVDVRNAMIASYAFGETFGNIVLSKA
jgi:3-oxoacyl-[acyl-carrier-protein] synthase II